ncbi:Signal recognition particle protein [Coemansia erecta]|uniref:Signal recognition particle protein n=1 Tax=Coemansia asiatica TaxID=1052880 RepID=A0A9W7XG45_9FUNG|nr:Signal recognition particle protein [Coemansia asiatica]KAJ2857241.1 Signal recognition particle protein [Coemansia erecta]KAJ2875275.1 Signal recognition particle protein [Coemansia asiatica]
MVYHNSWDAFEKAAENIYAGAPDCARYTIKYRNCDSALVLKVTDNASCVKLRTEKLEDIKRIAHLHRKLAQSASNRVAAIKTLSPIFPESPKELHTQQSQQQQQQTTGKSKTKTLTKKKRNIH